MVAAAEKPHPEWNGVLPPTPDLSAYDPNDARDYKELMARYQELFDQSVRLARQGPHAHVQRLEQVEAEMSAIKAWMLRADKHR